jgi:hypothetical protein
MTAPVKSAGVTSKKNVGLTSFAAMVFGLKVGGKCIGKATRKNTKKVFDFFGVFGKVISLLRVNGLMGMTPKPYGEKEVEPSATSPSTLVTGYSATSLFFEFWWIA